MKPLETKEKVRETVIEVKKEEPEEEIEEVVRLRKKPVKDIQEVSEELKIHKDEPKEAEYQITEESAEFAVKKPKKKPKPKPEKVVEETAEIKLPEEETPTVPAEEKFDVTLPTKPTPEKPVIEEVAEDVIKLPEEKEEEYKVTEEEAEVTVKKVVEIEGPEEIVEKPKEEETEEVVKIKRKKDIKKEVTEEAKVVLKKEEEKKYEVTEESAEFAIKKPKKKPKPKPEKVVEETAEIKLPEEETPTVPVEEKFDVTLPSKPTPEKPVVEETAEDVIKLPEEEEEKYKVTEEAAEVTVKKVIEIEGPEEIEEKPKEEETEEIVKIKRKKDIKKEVTEEAKVVLKKKEEKKQEITEESTEFAVKAPKKKPTTKDIPSDTEESFTLKVKLEKEKPLLEEVEEAFEVKTPKRKKKKPRVTEDEEESLSLKIPSKEPEKKTEVEEEVKIIIPREEAPEEPEVQEEITEEIEYVVVRTYVSEKTDVMSVVEGERVYVVERTSSDWWFVKKHLTQEKGLVPVDILKDVLTYTHFLKEKIDEKVKKLPVFGKPRPGEKMAPPKFVKKLQPLCIPDGQPATFECQVSGRPRPTITWFRQTQIIKPSSEFQIFYNEENVTTLVIREVFPEDAGTFTVVAKNPAGFSTCSAELLVVAPLSDHGTETAPTSRRSLSRESSLTDLIEGVLPVFSQPPEEKTVEENDTVDLTCSVTGVPEPTVTWYHKDTVVKETEHTIIKTVSDVDMVHVKVTIKNVTKEDSGTYKVIAKNTEGKTITTTALNVKEKPQPPKIKKKPKSKRVKPSEKVEFHATVIGKPKPTVKWYVNETEVKPDDRRQITVENNTHTLTIDPVEPSDAGPIIVKATNLAGDDTATTELTVEEPPKDEPPMFTQTFSDVIVTEKDTVKLTAKVTGKPPPEVTWYKNGKKLKPTKHVKQTYENDVCTLEIPESSPQKDTGEYKCVATNPVGETEHLAKVIVQKADVEFLEPIQDVEVKERDVALFVTKVSQEDAEVTWHKDGEQIIEGDKYTFIKEDKFRKLVINDAQVKDEGEYTCLLGDKECTADLVVVELPPEIKTEMVDVTVTKSEAATFQVELTKGDALVKWYKDGKEIQFSEHLQLKIDGKKQKLMIYNTTFEDAGTYTCVVGDKKCSATLNVEAPYVEFTAKLPEKTSVPQDTDATFTVQLSQPDAEVQWLKNGKPVQADAKFQLIKDQNVRKLVVRGVSKDDSAEYTCVAGNVKTSTKLQVEEVSAEFTLKLRDVIVRESDTATLLVEVTKDTLEVRWFKDGEKLTPSERIVIETEGKTRKLVIRETSVEDRGVYTCTLLDQECSSTVTVEAPPRVTTDQRKFSVKRGGSLTLEIPYSGLPVPKVEWHFNGKPLKPTKKVTTDTMKTKTTVSIKKMDDPEVGTYTLKMKNKVGESTTDFIVSIIDKPKPPGTPEASEITNESLILSWKAPESDGGAPITNYIIEYHDRDTLRWSTYNEDFTVPERHHKVTNVKEGMDYMFRVIAVNDAGKSDPSPGTKYITVKEAKAGEPPVVVEHLQDLAVGLKTKAVLQARITGQPPPTIKWLKNGKDLLVLRNITTTYENQIASLTIGETTHKSAAKYTCKATNSMGTTETSCTLKVQEPPSATFDENMKKVRLRTSSEYVLNVTTHGYPVPEVVWEQNGKLLESTKHTLVQTRDNTTSIIIRSVENSDTATYTLKLSNDAGTQSYDFRLRVLDKPGPPQGPITFPKTDKDQITVTWQHPSDDGGSDITNYFIERCDARRKVWLEVTSVPPDTTSYTVTDLEEGSEYMFRVSASNEYGRGEPLQSEPVTAKSPFDKPSAPKGPLQTSNMTSTSFTLSWQAPESDGGSSIIEYVVEKREVGRKAWQKVGTTDGKSLTMEITNLKKETAYNFRIVCRNEVGTSPPLAPEEPITPGAQIVPPSAPSGPLSIISMTNKTLTLSWKPPVSKGGTELSSYIIEKRETHVEKWVRVETILPTTTCHTVQNLSDKYEYFFRVLAENSAGLSPPLEMEEPVRLSTTAERPTPPTAPLEMRATGPSSIMIEWGKPESDGGSPLLGYNIVIRDIKRKMWMEVGQVDAETQRLQIRDLQEGHEYLVRIMARNEIGMSDALESEEPIKVVCPPGFLEVPPMEMEEHTASLSFSTETSSSWIREANVEPLLRSYTKHDLIGRNEYFFRVWHYAESLFK